MSVLQPAVVAAIADLELAARLVVEGTRAGPHRSPFRGFSTEFQQHRAYRAGDDLRHLDWKLLGRTDRLYTRQFRDTTNMSVMLVVDTSASMGFAGPDGVTKLRYASVLAAALAYLAITEGDAAGLLVPKMTSEVNYFPARGGRAHLRSLVARLDRLEPAGAWQPARVIARAAELLKRRGLIVVLSDFYDDEDETVTALKRAARRVVPAESMAGGYRAAVGDFLTRWRTRAEQHGMDYALVPTDTPPSRALRSYIVKRDHRPRALPR